MTKTRRINRLSTALLTCLAIVFVCRTAPSQEKDFDAYPEQVTKYLKRIYDRKQQPMAYREDYAGGLQRHGRADNASSKHAPEAGQESWSTVSRRTSFGH